MRDLNLSARLRAIAAAALTVAGALLILLAGAGSAVPVPAAAAGEPQPRVTVAAASAGAPAPLAGAVGYRVVTFVDATRTVHFHHHGTRPRTLITQIRYPAAGEVAAGEVPDAPPLRAAGPYPLVVFAHGFAETPTVYSQLLDAWARAGYVVAAPLFPLTQRYVPGGRRESDLINQPADMRFVISRMLDDSANPDSFLYGLLAPDQIAVAGQSDGAATALAVAFDPEFADRRIRAAVVLSGAELTLIDDNIAFPTRGPALLAAQGSRDPINEPSATHRYFALAPRPKFLLTLIGATHLPPYTTQQPYLGVVEQVTVAFMNHFLRDAHASLAHMRLAGNTAGVASLIG